MAADPLPPIAAPLPTPEPAGLSEGARIVNTFIAPSKTFTDLRRNASWWGPWLLISIFALIFVYSMDRQIGFDQISRNEIAHSPQADQFDKLSPDDTAILLAAAPALQHLNELDDEQRAAAYQAAGQAADPSANRARLEE